MDKNELIAAMWESELPPLAKLIFLAILDYRNAKTGDCYPSIETIASKTGIGRTTVISSVKIIDGLGFFTIKKVRPKYAKFTINSYIFNFDSSPDELSKQHSNDSSKHGSKHGSSPEPKPIELIEPKEGIDKSIPKKKREPKKISLKELDICHIADWLARKRSEGKYIHHNETDILEYFKTYCESKNKRYDDYAAALRLSFDWERNQPKGNTNGTTAHRQPVTEYRNKDQRAKDAVARAAERLGFAPWLEPGGQASPDDAPSS